MKLINDTSKPELVGMITEADDYESTMKIVESLNQDLKDSGFDRYQYKTVKRGQNIYVERV